MSKILLGRAVWLYTTPDMFVGTLSVQKAQSNLILVMNQERQA